ncbi:histone-lysine N-methyltransferase SETD1A-like [Asterias rubens]|uniref:histone-lysine N-methyltransferase SETD1A-like n=1 Tax=Asterias rubens TaxID=7604 RepID=UPI001455A16D|nr:histone-lysine N-methyltransferase SETD1A-like [Asterias rubens]
MDEFSSQHNKKFMSTSFNGVTEGPGPAGQGDKKWRNYKLLVDPILKKGQQKLYRYDGVAPGPSGADFSVNVVRDPRSRLSRFWKGREKYDLPVPKFKYDKHYVGELPPKQITITNLNDNVRDAFLRNMCEKYGTIEDINICFNPKTRKHLGLASVTFSTTRAARQAVMELNRTSVMGKIIIVQIDAGGTECERIYDCLISSSTPSSSSSTPRDPRHSISTPDTPTPRIVTADPRRTSLEGRTPSVAEGTPLSMPDHPFVFPEQPGYPVGSEQGFQGPPPPPPPGPPTPGLSGNFGGMNMHEYSGTPGGPQAPPYPPGFNRGGMEQFPPHSGNFITPEQHAMYQKQQQEQLAAQQQLQLQQQRGLPPGFPDPNGTMPYPPHMPHGKFAIPAPPDFHGQQNTNFNMYQDSHAWDHQNYGQQGTGQNLGYSNQDAQLQYGNHGHQGDQWDSSFGGQGMQRDFKSHHQQESDRSYSNQNFPAERQSDSSNNDRSRETREDSSYSKSKRKSKNQSRDPVPAPAVQESQSSESELAAEREATTPVQDEETKPPGTTEDDENGSDELNMSLDSRIEALLKRQSGAFGFDLDSSANSGKEDSTSKTASADFSPSSSPAVGDSPLLDEPLENRTGALQESSSEHSRTQSPLSHGRYDKLGKHWESHEKEDTAKHKSRTTKSNFERNLGRASYKRLQHSGEGCIEQDVKTSARGERYPAMYPDDSCSQDSFTSFKSTPEIRDTDKPSSVPSGASTPTVSEHTSQLNISAMISRELSNLRNVGDQVPSPLVTGSPMGSVNDSLGSTPVESEPQMSKLLAQITDSQSNQQVQLEIADALASRGDPSRSPSDMDMDDDRMSMSSLSSGEETKLEVNVPVPQRNERSYPTPPATMLRAPPEMPRSTPGYGQWPGVSLPGYTGGFSSALMTASPTRFPAGVGYGVQSQYPGANPYAIPQTAGLPGFPVTSVASTSLHNQILNQFAGMTPAQFGQMGTPQHAQMQMMARLGQFQLQPFNLTQPGFPSNPAAAFPDPAAQRPAPSQGATVPSWQQPNIPPPPHFHQFLQQFPQQFQNQPLPSSQSQQPWYTPPKPDPKEEIVSELLKTTFNELKKIMKKDLGRKMVESSAFKSLEAWWDDCELKFKEPLRISTEVEKPSPKIQPLIAIPFHSGSWATAGSQGKNHGLESIGLGLGVRAAMPRMPSFKVKRKVPEEDEDDEKKPRAETPQYIDEDVSDSERDKDGDKTSEKASVRRARKSLVSDDDDDFDDEEKTTKEIDEDEDEEEEEDEEEDSDESGSDFEDEIGSLKSESESSEEEEDEGSDASDSEESSSGSEMSSSEESDSEDEAKDSSKKDSRTVSDIKREEKLAKILEEKEEPSSDAKVKDKEVSEKKLSKKAVNGDATQKETVKDIIEKVSSAKTTTEQSDKMRTEDRQATTEEVEVATEVKSEDRMNSFELLVEMATQARTELLDEKPAEVVVTSLKTEEIEAAELLQTLKKKGVAAIGRMDGDIGRTSARDAEARLPEGEFMEEEVVMESIEDMEFEIDSKKNRKATLPKETADEQQPLLFLDHSYCQRPPLPKIKEPPPPTAVKKSPVGFDQPSVRLVKLDLSDKELTSFKETEENEIIDVVTEPEEEPPPKKQKSTKRKHKEEVAPMEEEVAIPEPSKPQFMPRNYYEEWTALYQFLALGVDQEDAFYLRKSYESMLQEGKIPWLSYTHWVSHSLTAIPDPPKKKRKTDEVRVHATGTARTEGFYKITYQEKKKYLKRLQTISQDKTQDNQDPSVTVISVSGKHNELSREARSDQRRAMATLSRQDGAVSDLLKFNQLKFRKKELKFLKSGIHGWGLYAMQPISADEMVIEYVGESIRQSTADERETRYEKLGIGSSYLFRIDADSIIDATKTGNLARFINHSCNPNCYAKIISMESQKKIVIYSKQNISTGEEITYDYKFPIEDEKIACLCGTAQCRGTLN